jgi:hypothetical protein
LRYAVVVGDPDAPPSFAAASEVEAKYCDREHSFLIGDASQPRVIITIQPRCLTTGVQDLDSWTTIYCDPAQCTSEDVAKDVMAAIGSDPDVLEFARRSSNTAISRGPYLISIK